jgi:hypothetical protein
MNRILTIIAIVFLPFVFSCNGDQKKNKAMQESTDGWEVDFFDDFETFNADNWQDQMIWVNNEHHCYVPDGQYNTREVSNGTLKLRVVDLGEKRPCDNLDVKSGEQHPPTQYVAGESYPRIARSLSKGNGPPD